jgi:antirestriction protein ArdC
MSLSITASRNSRYSSACDEVRLTPQERVTAQISSLLERGVRPWIKPWDDIAPPDALVMPLRSCGTPYRGMNIIALWAASLECGFRSRHWFTFKQALAMKACVRKGERGSFVVYYAEVGDKSDGVKWLGLFGQVNRFYKWMTAGFTPQPGLVGAG